MDRRSALLVLGVSCLPFIAAPAVALPGAATVVSGNIKISGDNSTINQSSKTGIINWGSFSIASGERVQFNNGSGATLNRVTTTGSISNIAGSLNATGSVYLINQNGVIITPGGSILTGGSFVASTRDVSDSAFKNGGPLEFTGASNGTVVNQGSITAGGNAVLIGQSATNDGAISANNGMAAVVAGDDVVLQPTGTGLRIQVKAGSGDATNTGSISAAQAMLNAVGGNVFALAGNTGVINATGTANIDGHVWLTAGGSVAVSAPVVSSGAVTIDGAGATAGANADGVHISQAVAAAGPISITGKGGNTGFENYGVLIDNNGAVVSTGKAPITISGTGGGGGGTSFGNDGVFIAAPTDVAAPGIVSANGGPISITGTGGASFGPDNFGITNEGAILNTGSGNITLAGTTGANGCGFLCSPIQFGEIGIANLGYIMTNTGDISMTGVVAPTVSGMGNVGIAIGNGVIATGGKGKVTLTGTSNGLGMDAGVLVLNYLGTAPVIVAGDGQMRITGTDNSGDVVGGNAGVAIQAGTILTAGRGDVTITGSVAGPGTAANPSAAITLSGTVAAGGKLKVHSDGGVVVNTGTLLAHGDGAAIIVVAPQGFLNFGTTVTPNGFTQVDNSDQD